MLTSCRWVASFSPLNAASMYGGLAGHAEGVTENLNAIIAMILLTKGSEAVKALFHVQ